IGCERDQLCYVFLNEIRIALRDTQLHLRVAALDPSRLLKLVPEGSETSHCFWFIRGQREQDTNPPHPLGLLRSRRQRPRRRAAKDSDECAPFHGGAPQDSEDANYHTTLGAVAPIAAVRRPKRPALSRNDSRLSGSGVALRHVGAPAAEAGNVLAADDRG